MNTMYILSQFSFIYLHVFTVKEKYKLSHVNLICVVCLVPNLPPPEFFSPVEYLWAVLCTV